MKREMGSVSLVNISSVAKGPLFMPAIDRASGFNPQTVNRFENDVNLIGVWSHW